MAYIERRWTSYEDAYDAAVRLARECRHDAYVRRQKEFGRDGYNIGLASQNDSDYATAEIVTPGHPLLRGPFGEVK